MRSQIARTFDISLNQAQTRLKKFEEIGLLAIRTEGTIHMYYFKKSPVTEALRVFLRSMLFLNQLSKSITEKAAPTAPWETLG